MNPPHCTLDVSEDDFQVFLRITEKYNRESCSLVTAAVHHLLNLKGIVHGIDPKAIDEAVAFFIDNSEFKKHPTYCLWFSPHARVS